VYGLFLDEEHKAWGFATRQGATKGATDWKQLAIDGMAERNPGVEVIDRHVLGQNVFEFSMAVVDDKGNRLGRLTYGMFGRSPAEGLERGARRFPPHALASPWASCCCSEP